MKKLIAILLAAVMVMGLAACGTINKTEVAVLWSGDGQVKVPNSLINAMERAMYIENIAYKHYGAEGDQAKQTQQAADALEAGCAALVVELVDPTAATQLAEQAKAKNVPLIFVNCDVEAAVVESYDKCVLVNTDATTAGATQGTMIGEFLAKAKGFMSKESNFEKMDANDDGKITYLALGDVSAAEAKINELLKEEKLPAIEAVDATAVSQLTAVDYAKDKEQYGRLVTASGALVEMIIAADDVQTMEAVLKLQEMGFNKDRLTTHFITVYTVGADADYKAHVLAGKPEGTLNSEAVQAYFRENVTIADLTVVEAGEDLAKMEAQMDILVYNTMNVIDAGRITGSAVEDYDAVAEAVAELTADLLTGKTVAERTRLVPYTTYGD